MLMIYAKNDQKRAPDRIIYSLTSLNMEYGDSHYTKLTKQFKQIYKKIWNFI